MYGKLCHCVAWLAGYPFKEVSSPVTAGTSPVTSAAKDPRALLTRFQAIQAEIMYLIIAERGGLGRLAAGIAASGLYSPAEGIP